MKTSEILDKAAEQIALVGWERDDWYAMPTGFGEFDWTECRVCAGGGINLADGLEPDFDDHTGLPAGRPAVQAFMALAKRVDASANHADVDDAVSAVIRWNDHPDRTAEQVVATLRAAAASEREAGR